MHATAKVIMGKESAEVFNFRTRGEYSKIPSMPDIRYTRARNVCRYSYL